MKGETWRGKTRAEYFWSHVNCQMILNKCWPWNGHISAKGYGQFADGKGGSMPAHRFAWEFVRGPIPEGLVIDHLCRNRACQNVAHMAVVTPVENTARGESFSVFNARKTHCAEGHSLTLENVYPGRKNRACRICAQERASAWYWANRDRASQRAKNAYRARVGPPKPPPTYCQRGHALVPENLYVHEGRKRCKACARVRDAERRAGLR